MSDGKITLTETLEDSNTTPLGASEDNIVEVINVTSLNSIAEQPATNSNIVYGNIASTTNVSHQNAVSNQQGMNGLGMAVVGRSTNEVSNLNPVQARSAVDVITNNEVADTIADLKSVLEAFGGGGGNTPPNPSSLIEIIEKLINLIEVERAFSGDGQYDTPVVISTTDDPLFITLPFYLGIRDVTLDQIDVSKLTS